MKILVIKTTSLGDIVHTFPAVSQINKHFPQAQIDWAVEEEFSSLPLLHRAVANIRITRWRKWKNQPLAFKSNYAQWRQLKQKLKEQDYDVAIDAQLLLKSALVGKGIGAVFHGLAKGRDPFASLYYDEKHTITAEKLGLDDGQQHDERQQSSGIPVWRDIPRNIHRDIHKVPLMMKLCATSLGYAADISDCDYGIDLSRLKSKENQITNTSSTKQKVFLCHKASQQQKELPDNFWQDLIAVLSARGYQCILPGHSDNERAHAHKLADGYESNCDILPRLSIREIAQVMLSCNAVISLDTGLAHLATALDLRTIAIYLVSDPLIFGCYGNNAINLTVANNPKLKKYSPSQNELFSSASSMLRCEAHPQVTADVVMQHIK